MPRARGPTYVVPFKRRGMGVTNYRKRAALLKAGLPRFVVRKSTRTVSAQLIQFAPEGDKTIAQANSNELKKIGWFPTTNLPTAYLVGKLCALRGKEKKIEKAILDIGLARLTKGHFATAALKGAIDAGLEIPHSIKFDEARIKGKHIAEYARMLKERYPERYKRQFGAYLRAGHEPEKIVENFEKAQKKLNDYLSSSFSHKRPNSLAFAT